MKELEKQYNKDVKNPANFNFDKRSYMAGGRTALEWVLQIKKTGTELAYYEDDLFVAIMNDIEKELEDENIQNRNRWCKDCRAKIEAAKDLDCIAICNTCSKRKRK